MFLYFKKKLFCSTNLQADEFKKERKKKPKKEIPKIKILGDFTQNYFDDILQFRVNIKLSEYFCAFYSSSIERKCQ